MRIQFSLAGQFLLASLAVLLVGMLVIGAWVGQQIEQGVLSRTAGITALYVDSIVAPHLQPLAAQTHLDPPGVAALDRLLSDTPLGERIVAFKVWSPDGKVLYSPNRQLIGRTFSVRGGLERALGGEVAARMSNLNAPENEYERQRWDRLLEVYVPLREPQDARVVAVTEVYQAPDELEREVGAARLRSWAVVAAATGAMYALLAGIVKRGSDTIVRQQAALSQKVEELSGLLNQNTRLHQQLRRAAERTTTLNERALRRIGADLHDGPGQALALGLLRLGALEERCSGCAQGGGDLVVVQNAMQEALREIRAISAGLRLPELAPLSLTEVAERAVRSHVRRTSRAVDVRVHDLTAQAPLSLKIAIYRALQEALANASRHGQDEQVRAHVWGDAGWLNLEVSDQGPGFNPDAVETDDHLGLAGMRERATLLGGELTVESVAGQGSTVRARWPLPKAEVA